MTRPKRYGSAASLLLLAASAGCAPQWSEASSQALRSSRKWVLITGSSGRLVDIENKQLKYQRWLESAQLPFGVALSAIDRRGRLLLNSEKSSATVQVIRDVETGRAVCNLGDTLLNKARWSPNSKFIVGWSNKRDALCVVELRDKVPIITEIMRANVQTGACLPRSAASWSPDGRQLAVEMNETGARRSSVYLINRDGTRLRRLCCGSSPAWHPDGKVISFFGGFKNRTLFSIDVETGTKTALCRLPLRGAQEMAEWHPDGRFLATHSKYVWPWPYDQVSSYYYVIDTVKHTALRVDPYEYWGWIGWARHRGSSVKGVPAQAQRAKAE